MAGIGFRLQKILQQGTFRSVLAAYAYSTIVSTGPWLLSVLGIGLISLFSAALVAHPDLLLFRAVVVYAYAGSLIVTGPLHLGTTRYVADRLYVRDAESLAPCYHWTATLGGLASGLAMGALLAISTLPLSAILGAVALTQAIALVWIGMIFLSAAKDYLLIVRAFALGHGLSVAGALLGGREWGLPGMIWGYAVGQAALALLLGVRIRVEFPARRASDRTVLAHWRGHFSLALIGFAYNLGIWADKIVFWLSPYGESLGGTLRICTAYDTCIFLGYLSIVPAMALFLIRIETGFYKQYAAFYETVTGGGTLADIEGRKKEMMSALRLSVIRLLKVQGPVTVALVIFAGTVAHWLGLDPARIVLLRIAFLAALTQVLLLILMILVLYFDWQRDVARIAVLFLVSNVLFSQLSLYADPRYHGLGYLLACLVSLCAGLMVMERRLSRLEFDTFTREPIRG